MMRNRAGSFVAAGAGALAIALAVHGESTKVVSSYGPTNQDVTFSQIKADRLAVKAGRAKAHAALLASRYDLEGRAVGIGATPALIVSAGNRGPLSRLPARAFSSERVPGAHRQ